MRNGTAYAESVGIKVTLPRWGVSRSEYCYDTEKRVVAKGLSSIKYMSEGTADELYRLAHAAEYPKFTDVLRAIDSGSSVNARQLDILIKTDFFAEFGNQRELLRITELFAGLFNRGLAKKIAKEKVDGTPIGEIVAKYSVGVTKSGGSAKSYTVLDIDSVMNDTEDAIRAANLPDLDLRVRMQNFKDAMGYAGYSTGREEDRRKLFVTDVFPLKRKSDGKQFAYGVSTRSVGSGKESTFTVMNPLYKKDPVNAGDVIYCKSFVREKGKYFKLTDYFKI